MAGLRWLKLQQKRPRFEIRNDPAMPSKAIKRHKGRWQTVLKFLRDFLWSQGLRSQEALDGIGSSRRPAVCSRSARSARRTVSPRAGLLALTPQDKTRSGPGRPGCCGCLLGTALGQQCLGGRSALKRSRPGRSEPQEPRPEPGSCRAQGTLGPCVGGGPGACSLPTSPGSSPDQPLEVPAGQGPLVPSPRGLLGTVAPWQQKKLALQGPEGLARPAEPQ